MQLLLIMELMELAHEASHRRVGCAYSSGRARHLIESGIPNLLEVGEEGLTISKWGNVIGVFFSAGEARQELALHFEPVVPPIEQLGVVGDAPEGPSVILDSHLAGIVGLRVAWWLP